MANIVNINNLNITLTNMSREELETEYLDVKSLNSIQLKKLDDSEQKIYELKRQISTLKAMEEHLTCELEILQTNNKSEVERFSKKITNLEEEIVHLKQAHMDNIQLYESEIVEKNSKITSLTENLKDLEEKSIDTTNTAEISKFNDEIYELKSTNEDLTLTISKFELKSTEAQQKISYLENKNSDLSNELDDLKECLNSTKHELQECNGLVRNLQDEVIIMQMELDKYKSGPLENAAKGNSLFAEVDDNRLKLKKHIEVLNKKYADMKLKYGNKALELQKLHIAYAALIKQIENKTDSHEDQCDLIKSYKRNFDKQSEIIKNLEKEIEFQKAAFTKIMSGDIKCATDLVTLSRDEILNIRRELKSESFALLLSEQKYYDTKKELRKWQTDTMQLRAQVLVLNQTIEELKLNKQTTTDDDDDEDIVKASDQKLEEIPIENTYLSKAQTDPIRSSTFTYLEDWDYNFGTDEFKPDLSILSENKENIEKPVEVKKKVSFTVDNKSTERLGRKVVTAPAIHIPSIKRK